MSSDVAERARNREKRSIESTRKREGLANLTSTLGTLIIFAPGRSTDIPMIKTNLHLVFVAIAALLCACTDNPVGRICDLGIEAPNPNESVVASPSLDCQSRTCLKVPLANQLPEGSRYPEGNKGLCTAECETDDDCDRVPESPCKTGFTCAIPVVVGPFCCQKMCICKDYIVRSA